MGKIIMKMARSTSQWIAAAVPVVMILKRCHEVHLLAATGEMMTRTV
jgi:hypothetical protein